MGLFSRNESASGSERRTGSRSSLSSEAQANELRSRARRRLIGALALVLVAVIVVPMLFDTSTTPEQDATPVVMPTIDPPVINEGAGALAQAGSDTLSGTIQQPDADHVASVDDGTSSTAATATPAPDGQVETAAAEPPRAEAAPPPKPKPEPKHESKPEPAPSPKPAAKQPVERTDDGAVALAMLEGRTPPKKSAAPAASGNFTLQIAAYSTDDDAKQRRDKLVASGVTNTYVERASSGGKTTYRLRVGPFPSREAAQAAQARLRALGYDNGFISAK